MDITEWPRDFVVWVVELVLSFWGPRESIHLEGLLHLSVLTVATTMAYLRVDHAGILRDDLEEAIIKLEKKTFALLESRGFTRKNNDGDGHQLNAHSDLQKWNRNAHLLCRIAVLQPVCTGWFHAIWGFCLGLKLFWVRYFRRGFDRRLVFF